MNTTDEIMDTNKLRLLALESFDYIDGNLHWKKTAHPPRTRGKKAGSIEVKGYYVVGLGGKIRKLHRIVFLMHHGYFPEMVDHINGDKLDNRIENLRPANNSQNICNSGVRSTNSSGFKGVSRLPSGRWQSAIRTQHGRKYLGSFDRPELAHAAYVEAACKYHGEYARFA